MRSARPAAYAALLPVLLTLCAGCGSYAAGARFRETFPTKEAAAQAVLDAIWARDDGRLRRLAVSEEEFRTMVWPRLPASRPDVGMPLDYLWRDLARKSNAGVADGVQTHGRRRLSLQSIEFGGPATDYGTFRIHPKTSLVVVDDRGEQSRVRLFGSMIEASGAWKIYSFVVD